MQVILADQPPEDWDELVKECPWGSFYHTTGHLKLLAGLTRAQIRFLVGRDKDRILGGIAFGIQDGPLGAVVNCLPYFGSYGEALTRPGAPENTEKTLYKALLDQCREDNALSLCVITSPFSAAERRESLRQWLSSTFYEDRLCQITPLPQPASRDRATYLEQIMQTVSGRARTAYRKAVKAPFTLRTARGRTEEMAFADIHRANIEGRGVFKTERFFAEAGDWAEDRPEEAKIKVVLEKNRVVAGVVFFYCNRTVEYHTTCLDDAYRSAGPLNRIIIEEMTKAGLAGYGFFNFGGTWKSQEGVYRFKESFGARDFAYSYHTRFFRDLDRVRALSAEAVREAYPLCFVIPFSECQG